MLARPQIDQEQVSPADRTLSVHRRCVVGVGGILVRANDRRVIEFERRLREATRDPLLELVFGNWLVGAAALPRLLERRARRRRDDLRGAPVRRELRVRPQGVELRHQRARRDDLGPGRPHHLEHPARHAVEVRHRVARRILHGDFLSAHQRHERLLENLPAAVTHPLPLLRPAVPGPLLDVVRHGHRHPLTGHPGKNAPRHDPVESQRPGCDRIRILKVEEEPAVELRIGERALEGGKRVGSQHRVNNSLARVSCGETWRATVGDVARRSEADRPPLRAPFARPLALPSATHVLHRAAAGAKEAQ